MRDLVQNEMKAVAGGFFVIDQPGFHGQGTPRVPSQPATPPPPVEQVAKKKNKIAHICDMNGLSDQAKIETTANSKGQLSILGNGTEATNGLKISTTCGNERKHGKGN